MVVEIDPVTGALVTPSPERMQALGGAVEGRGGDAALQPLPEIVSLPEGGTLLVLDQRYASYATVRVTPAGLVYGCSGDPERPAPPTAPRPGASRYEER